MSKRKDAYYFSHDSNAKDDPKCSQLIEELQLEGYGIYWVLVETLRDQADYKYSLKYIPALARRYFTSKEKMFAVIKNYDLFEVEDDMFFYSRSLNERMGIANAIREKAKLAGIKSGEARRIKALTYEEKNEQTLNVRSTDVEQLKEKKGKEINETKLNKDSKEKKVYLELPDIERVKITKEDLESLIKSYNKELVWETIKKMNNWLLANGKSYKNYYRALLNWLDNKKEG